MTTHKPPHGRTSRPAKHHRPWITYTVVAFLIAAVGGAAAAAVTSGQSKSTLRRTGETNEMGMPVIANPGTATGTVAVSGVTAAPASWALGRIPLNVAVRPAYLLRNTGTDAIVLGEPQAEIRQGCCPGPFTFDGPSTLAPGAETHMTFELSMHPGMDGWHDMAIHVPVHHASGMVDDLVVNVTGDFRA